MNVGSRGVVKILVVIVAAVSVVGLAAVFIISKSTVPRLHRNASAIYIINGKQAGVQEPEQQQTAVVEFADPYSNEDYGMPRGVNISAGQYADGVYEGKADGYSEGLVVQVKISNGLVESITVKENYETPGFFEYVFEEFAELIVSSQSTDLDAVSGATYTSNAYLAAVENALDKARIK